MSSGSNPRARVPASRAARTGHDRVIQKVWGRSTAQTPDTLRFRGRHGKPDSHAKLQAILEWAIEIKVHE
jgi:hypothetical protein